MSEDNKGANVALNEIIEEKVRIIEEPDYEDVPKLTRADYIVAFAVAAVSMLVFVVVRVGL